MNRHTHWKDELAPLKQARYEGGRNEIRVQNHGEKIWRRLEKESLGIRINTNYETHHQYTHAQINQKMNDQRNTTRISGMNRRIELNTLWPENENINTNRHPKHTIKQEIEKTHSQSNTSTAKVRGENAVKLGSSLAGGGHGTADSVRDPLPPEESLSDENRDEGNTTMKEP